MVDSPQEEQISVKQKLEVAEQRVYTNIKQLSQREETNGATEEEGKKKDFLKYYILCSISFSDVQKTFGLFLTTYQQLQNILNDASLDLY